MYKEFGMQEEMQKTRKTLESFWNAKLGFYVDYLNGDHFDTLSNTMLLEEDLVPPERVKNILDMLLKVRTKYGYLNLYPWYPFDVCSQHPYQYQNSTIWPFVEYEIARVFIKYGMIDAARRIKSMMEAREGVNEWYSPVNGKPDGSKDQLWTACAYIGVFNLTR
jgi:glycogen debranching enzyme